MKISNITKASLLTISAVQGQINNPEVAICSGQCAQGLKNTIESNGAKTGTVVTVLGNAPGLRSSGSTSNESPENQQVLLETQSIFTDIAVPAENEASPRFGLVFKIPVINNYGCWCYGGASWPGARDTSGFGEPKDVYDDACKAHHMGFDCITLDADAENESCIPNETTYNLLVTPLSNGDYTLECADSIADHWCKRRVCLVDIRFIARQWKLESEGIKPDLEAYGHPGHHNNVGNFDTKVCEVAKNNKPNGNGNGNGGQDRKPQKVCCGDYPFRIWYDKNNNKGVKCCSYQDPSVITDYGFTLKVGKLYNSMSATCCNDGVVNGSNVCS